MLGFTPATTQTKLAKILAGAMIGLALFTALSLAWIVSRRDRLGRVTRVLTRSAWALALGLGGWFAAALVVLVAFPSVPVDEASLIVISMAAPVALASYCAWRGPAAKLTGLAAATAGAVIGASVGFTSGTAMLAVLTTLVGAVAGTNLALIATDITSDIRRQAKVREPVLA
jgi:hypothetical protein